MGTATERSTASRDAHLTLRRVERQQRLIGLLASEPRHPGAIRNRRRENSNRISRAGAGGAVGLTPLG